MPFRYTPPIDVTSPQDCVENIRVLFDGGTAAPNHFSVVKLDWDGETSFAMRWNISEREWDDADKISGDVICTGMPVSHGHPVWFVLPKSFLDTDCDVWKTIKQKLKDFDGK